MPNQNHSTPPINVYATVAYWLLLAILVMIPLAVFPVFENFITTSKSLLLMTSASLTFGIFSLRAAKKGKLQLPVNPLVGSLFLFGVAILISSLFSATYPVKNLLGMGGVYLSVVMMAILGGSLLPKKKSVSFIQALSVSGSLITLTTLMQMVGFGPSRIINSILPLQLANDLTFNVAGSPFVAAQLLGLAIIGSVVYLVKERKLSKFLLATLVINVVGFAINTWVSLPGQIAAPLMLPFTAGWPIALDTLRTPRPALIGVGPDNYALAYSNFREAWTNVTDWWNVQFTQGTNVPLTMLTTAGILGLGSWLLVLGAIFKQVKESKKDSELLALSSVALAVLVLQIFFAANLVTLTVLAIALAFMVAATRKKFVNVQAFAMKVTSADYSLSGRTDEQPQFAKYLSGGVALVLTGALLYVIGRGFLASNVVFRSLLATQDNNAVEVYQLQQRATVLNPYMDSYRRRYAQTNIQIAAAISNKADLTEEEQTQVAQLIQQAIREARAAALLGPDDFQNWSVLAQIYRNLIGTAEDAPDWAVSAYVQAINTAPVDANLRIELGGIFYNQENYAQALSLFQQAADLKPDMPNAYYNAANTLAMVGEYEQAKAAYQTTLLLLEPDSDSYIQASKELEQVEAMIEQTAGQEGEEGNTAGQTGTVPSILNQTVNQNDAELINTPSSQPLNETTQQNLGAEETGEYYPEQTPEATQQPAQ